MPSRSDCEVAIVEIDHHTGIYHRVWWKLFRPVDADTIEVFDLTVDRVGPDHVGPMTADDVDGVTITGLQIRLGTLRREK